MRRAHQIRLRTANTITQPAYNAKPSSSVTWSREAVLRWVAVAVLSSACATATGPKTAAVSPKMEAARNIVNAVNGKSSAQYVRDMAEHAVVTMYDGQVRLRGREAIQKNREGHFRAHPNAVNELVHLVEIDDRVVMHDRVRLQGSGSRPADIVEVFTFKDDLIVRIDVLQPADLFGRGQHPPPSDR